MLGRSLSGPFGSSGFGSISPGIGFDNTVALLCELGVATLYDDRLVRSIPLWLESYLLGAGRTVLMGSENLLLKNVLHASFYLGLIRPLLAWTERLVLPAVLLV